ncbi:ABC transporter substrate-binding protein [Bradyrhizobium sp. AUGA SZCCT0169]|uniref:ABC transporter substrate-binding protein n=1 Tax=Bradyrhizobium sp. AUGA SZCCT0169 TaxID=2807663 RepID=UPI001BAB79CC|nr:ABC transporter substrate-binding protein [Bradyrhizobium sp. AUGA SZCCT0169]MBR1245853.1 ABC transporter substrate-binding protein [Bradyrhizobium sp. AUGA SZCCT0169]
MKRREFIGTIGTVALLPLMARAQQSKKVYRIAILHPSHPVAELTEVSSFRYWREFFQELRRHGYVEGQNLTIERYSGEGRVESYPKLARDVSTRSLDLIFAITVWMVAPLKDSTRTTPIVAMTSDPVDLGLVSSMARPGGNITGVSVDAGLEIWGKRLQLFREVAPAISKLGILALRRNPEGAAMQATAEKAGISVVGSSFLDNGSEPEYRRVFALMSQEGADALFVDGSPEHITKRQLIGELAEKYQLPAIYPFRSFVEAGGLMAYGIDFLEIFRQVARTIDQILKGAQPGDIPFQQPTKFELVINRKAATNIGLLLPEPLLARADEVIE